MRHLIKTVFALSFLLGSCKRNDFTKAELIGIWSEIPLCVRGTGYYYILQFTSNNKVYESSPVKDTGNYILLGNNMIRLDSSIVWLGWQLTRSLVFQIMSDNDEMTIKIFFTSLIWGGLTLPLVEDVHLNKM
jgi:hypothetical protein